jgi:hypothetical protein
MKRAFFAASLVVGIALLAGLVTSNSSGLTSPGRITLSARAVNLQVVDRGPVGRGAGDLIVKRLLLFNKGIRPRAIGHADVICTYTTRHARQCDGTYTLPKGKIVVTGSYTFGQFHELAVTGGTGIYDNVRGTLTVTLLARNPERDLLVFRLIV